jgi:hypothetical protein
MLDGRKFPAPGLWIVVNILANPVSRTTCTFYSTTHPSSQQTCAQRENQTPHKHRPFSSSSVRLRLNIAQLRNLKLSFPHYTLPVRTDFVSPLHSFYAPSAFHTSVTLEVCLSCYTLEFSLASDIRSYNYQAHESTAFPKQYVSTRMDCRLSKSTPDLMVFIKKVTVSLSLCSQFRKRRHPGE